MMAPNERDAQLANLKLTRGQTKAHLTRFKTYLAGLTDDFDKTELEARLSLVQPCLEKFEVIQTKIEELLESVDDDERATFENTYFKLTAEAKNLLIKISQSSPIDNTSISQNTNTADNDTLSARSNTERVKLPKLSLPEFGGLYTQWVSFQETYDALINNNLSLSPIEKFYYLKSCLKGEAAQLIQSLEISQANYDIAWQMLKERYQNKKLIIHTHLKAIFELGTLKGESHQALRKLLDNFNKNVRALTALGQPTAHWDTLLVYIFASKLDSVTKREFEESIADIESPKVTDLTEFISKRCQLLETIESKAKPFKSFNVERSYANLATRELKCSFCEGAHANYNCDKLIKMTQSERWAEIRSKRVCSNCLRPGHFKTQCKSSGCKQCKGKHNTMLHTNAHNSKLETNAAVETNKDENVKIVQNSVVNASATIAAPLTSIVLLATAKVLIRGLNGKLIECRALLDGGAMSNFITRDLLKKLRLKTVDIDVPVSGISNVGLDIREKTETVIYSRNHNYKTCAEFLVINAITGELPQTSFTNRNLKLPNNIELADPTFNICGSIDMLLGASIFYDILCIGQIKGNKGEPILQKTKLGWVVSGPVALEQQPSKILYNLNVTTDEALREQIEAFWKVEHVTQNCDSRFSKEERECEEHFRKTLQRDPTTGRFQVSLPWRENVSSLGESKQNATKQFYNLEKRLSNNLDLKREYIEFMRTYEAMGHMTRIDLNDHRSNGREYYLPHHGVLKESRTTTKLRVVFNASAGTTSGLSLNDVLKVGPILQNDLFAIVIKFRKHNVVMVADIQKMYRQVMVDPRDREYQKILWRENPSETLKCYRLNTVTYGTAPASFLAVRSLQQAASDYEGLYPQAADIIQNDFYMDDLLTGAQSLEDAVRLKCEITKILNAACFPLQKWRSNENSFFNNTEPENHDTYFISDSDTNNIKTLGLIWNPTDDSFRYSLQIDYSRPITKRTMLSAISKLFDPLGLVNPTIIVAKIIMQKLWQCRIDWDESVPVDLYTSWQHFLNELVKINEIIIPRHVICSDPVKVELHGFCDASERAYGACVYIRSKSRNGRFHSNLLCAKSRVAPLKTIALPRLELCGAVLLTLLMKRVQEAMTIKFANRYYWCDSTIVLSWLNAEPTKWKTFVANRVTIIQENSLVREWNHVRSELNPADIVSRGANPESLIKSQLWWHGPYFLMQDISDWPIKNEPTIVDDAPELRPVTSLNFIAAVDTSICDRFSSLSKLQRVVAFMYRFFHNSRVKNGDRRNGNLTADELTNAINVIVRLVQTSAFDCEIRLLTDAKPLPKRSKILSLTPFLDENGLLRVGGRIRHALVSYDTKHPLILPSKHIFTELIIIFEHTRHLHAGAQTVLAAVRRKFWPIHGKSAVKRILHKCVTCSRLRPKFIYPLMGDLPPSRVAPERPFSTVGVDFAGPILVKDGTLRTRKLVKAYLCIFVCFATKAVHIELAGGLSTEIFLNTLKRFVARRGLCKVIYSDNATNFVGARNELEKYKSLIKTNIDKNEIRDFLLKNQIEWSFIPPRSPNFGGLWEAAVKSAKTHLHKVLRDAHLNYEQLYTVLCQVEGILNSRPLIPSSVDPNDLSALTPGHFLVGDALTAVPNRTPNENHTSSSSSLRYYERLRSMVQHFWKRWSGEYLRSLQARSKWKRDQGPEVKLGTMVLVGDDNLPPMQWRLGRIVDLHPGSDNVVRVVSVKTNSGVLKRAITKLGFLPIDTQ